MNARDELIGYALAALPNEPAFAKCEQLADAFRAEVLREAADDQTSEPIPVRWDRTVIHPDAPNGWDTGEFIVCCIADDGRPVALFLDDEHREALALLLIDPDPS